MEGLVAYGSKEMFAFLRGNDGATYFCPVQNMPADEIGRKYLTAGEWVSFDLYESNKKLCARNVKVLSPRKPVPPSYREIGTVIRISPKGDFCFLRRPFFADDVFLSASRAEGNFCIGQKFSYKVSAPDYRGRNYHARSARLVSESESIEQANETDLKYCGCTRDKIVGDLNEVLEDAGK
jgi:hypothetical protein